MSEIGWGELHEARQLARLGKSLSRAAQGRLQWMLFYVFNGRNAARTCRRFAISRQTFYRWKWRFNRHDLRTLEERSHRPRSVRQPTWAPALAERVLSLRQQYPRWGKDKLVVLLAREKCRISTSMVGRILVYWKRRGVLHEPPKLALLRQARRKLAKTAMGHSQLNTANRTARRFGGDRYEGDRMRRRRALKALQRARCRLALGCAGGPSPRDFASGSAVPGNPAGAFALSGKSFAGGWRKRIRRRVRGSLPAKTAAAVRASAKSPKLNAHVERSHRTHNEEFYEVQADSDQLPALNQQLRRWEKTYNCVRPHQSSPTSPRSNFSLDGSRILERQSVTNLLDEYSRLDAVYYSSYIFRHYEDINAVLVGCLGTLVAAAHSSQDRSTVDLAPPNTYIDKGACPF